MMVMMTADPNETWQPALLRLSAIISQYFTGTAEFIDRSEPFVAWSYSVRILR